MSVSDRFMIIAGKIGSQRHLCALRDSFAMVMPIIIAGALVTTLNNIHIMFGLETSFLPEFIKTIDGNVWWGTFNMLALFISILLGYNLGKSYDYNPPITAVIAFASYLTITPQAPPGGAWGSLAGAYTAATGLFVSMLVSIMASEIFIRLSKRKALVLKMPEGVPPAVARSFSALIPGVMAIILTAIVVYALESLLNAFVPAENAHNIFEWVSILISSPITNLADSLISAIVIVFLNSLLWIFGLHGSNILDSFMQSIFLPMLDANINAANMGEALPHIVTKQMFDTFVYMGGAGVSLGLVIAILISSKNKTKRTVASVSFAASLFNINEPLIFGLPIVLNLYLAVPFILAPIVTTVVAYFAMYFDLVGRTMSIAPWATPPILSAFLTTTTPIRASILQIINIIISILIYMPFISISDRAELRQQK